MIYEKLNIELPRQKLYYGGKELISDHYVIDYHVRCNDVIQLIVRSYGQQLKDIIQAKSNYYKIGDCIDVIYKELGAWFEAKIVNIFTVQNDSYTEQDLIFEIVMDRNEKTAPLSVKFHDIRPRYDLKVTTITDATLAGILLMGQNHEELHDCLIEFKDEVMKIEKPMLLTERTSKEYHNIPWKTCLQKIVKSAVVTFIFRQNLNDCKIDENEIVKPGEKLKVNSSSFIETSERRTIIPKSYFGPIPNVNVGTCWKSQM
ncbi:hypothetical protein BDFB_011493, partial [Asbolus verrucosus]